MKTKCDVFGAEIGSDNNENMESDNSGFVVRSFTRAEHSNLIIMLQFLKAFKKKGMNLNELPPDLQKWTEEHGIPLLQRQEMNGTTIEDICSKQEMNFKLNARWM